MGVKEGVRYLFRYTSLGLERLRLVGEQPTNSQAWACSSAKTEGGTETSRA